MQLDAKTHTIDDVLKGNRKYIIPRFQREYSWGKDELLALWEDHIFNVSLDKYDEKNWFLLP